MIISACNPQAIRRSRLQGNEGVAQPDSFLYYQPVAIADPFLDSLKLDLGKEQSVKVRLIPPLPPPAPTTKQVQGFRVQTFAGLDSLNALVSVEKLKITITDSIYFFKESNLFRRICKIRSGVAISPTISGFFTSVRFAGKGISRTIGMFAVLIPRFAK